MGIGWTSGTVAADAVMCVPSGVVMAGVGAEADAVRPAGFEREAGGGEGVMGAGVSVRTTSGVCALRGPAVDVEAAR